MMNRSRAVTPQNNVRSRVLQMLMAGAVTIAALVVTNPSFAEGRGRGPGGPGMMFAGPPEMVARHVDHMLKGLNASAAQRTQVQQIAEAAAVDLRAQRATMKSLRERGLQIFTAPTVDAAAAESVRQQLQNQRDESSRRVLQAMLDVSRVLTAEQRAAIGARMQERAAHRHDPMQAHPQAKP